MFKKKLKFFKMFKPGSKIKKTKTKDYAHFLKGNFFLIRQSKNNEYIKEIFKSAQILSVHCT